MALVQKRSKKKTILSRRNAFLAPELRLRKRAISMCQRRRRRNGFGTKKEVKKNAQFTILSCRNAFRALELHLRMRAISM
jgi:hypothetical protein